MPTDEHFERLIRIEEKQDYLIKTIEKHIEDEDKNCDRITDAETRLTTIEVMNKTGWKLICAFGAITVTVSGFISWVISIWRTRTDGF